MAPNTGTLAVLCVILVFLQTLGVESKKLVTTCKDMQQTVYGFKLPKLTDVQTKEYFSLGQYRNKALVVTNVATY